MMADKEQKYPKGTQLTYPDGTVFVYAGAAQSLKQGTFADPNENGRLVKFKGGLVLPTAVICEDVSKGEFTFAKLHNGQVPKEDNRVITPERK